MIKKNYQPRPLDEVIDLLSSIYYNDQKKAIKDAIFYLKEYKDKIYTFAYQAAEMRQYLEEKNNKPLTWDELKTMEGKPVWLEGSAFADGFWTIPNYFGDSGGSEYFFAEGDQYWKEHMRDADDGLSWQAYRKEK